MLPPLPPGGIEGPADRTRLPGVEVVHAEFVAFGPGSVYAYQKVIEESNLFRVPIP